uniref:hypothetical protein n=1 Tax=Methylobacterium sp. B34 TaxID=95563 RepID=UPI0005B2D553
NLSLLNQMVDYEDQGVIDYYRCELTPLTDLTKIDDFYIGNVEAISVRRDAMYDPKRLWLIWEQADRELLASWLLSPEKALIEATNGHRFLDLPYPE